MIPCGKCIGCAADRRLEWAIRMCHEAQGHDQNSFLTLTYDDNHLVDKLDVEHCQQFIRDLRYAADVPIRYFITGEYGDQTRRPHYHAIIFGADFLGGRYTYRISDQLYGNKWLEDVWRFRGHIAIGQFSTATAMYVAGYVNKKLDDTDTFSLMSRQPPLGKHWIKQHLQQSERLGNTVIDGQEFPVPKRYWTWALKEGWIDEDGLSLINKKRKSHLVKRDIKAMRNREINQRSKLALKEETI